MRNQSTLLALVARTLDVDGQTRHRPTHRIIRPDTMHPRPGLGAGRRKILKHAARVPAGQKIRQCLDLERAPPEDLNTETGRGQHVKVTGDRFMRPRGQFKNLRGEQSLRGHSATGHAALQALEKNALMRRPLIEEHKTFGPLEQQIAARQRADQAECEARPLV